MEKFIELLNEYEIWKWKNGLDIRQQYAEHNFKYNKWLCNIVISKKYKFIKRLVENDKINRDKVEKENADYYFIEMFDNDEIMLMLLSIQDNPIDFLISILK